MIENLSQLNQGTLDARWRELQKESARTKDNAVIEQNARDMADISRELEKRRREQERRDLHR